jgi:Uma2 family endonuclease
MALPMNVAFTHAADGLPRRAFTVGDIDRMINAGVIGQDERFEVIEGDLVMMSAKHAGHDRVKHALTMALAQASPKGMYVGVAASLQLAPDILVEPDITIILRSAYKVHPKSFVQPRPEDLLLLIEIAASSMTYDRGLKARIYARHGIREFWVIDANEYVTWIHTGPSGDDWSSIVERSPNETLTTPVLPNLAIKLSEID